MVAFALLHSIYAWLRLLHGIPFMHCCIIFLLYCIPLMHMPFNVDIFLIEEEEVY